MVTTINMKRVQLITKEKMERFLHDKYEEPPISVNDDLDIIFEDIRLGISPNPRVQSIFCPMLTEKEMKLVEIRDINYLGTLRLCFDIDKAEMLASESKSKFVDGNCFRHTFSITNLKLPLLNRRSRLGAVSD